ncbi:MAG: mechanosensitive ion channel [Ruminococcaceae bacterium]|nr:mechanosensitive ion channel [Oscillospiraceae bacterium]
MGKILNFSIGSLAIGKLLSAVLIFIVGYFLIKYAMKLIGKMLDKTKLEGTIKGLISVIVKVVLFFLLALVAADSLGIDTTSFIAAFSVVGLAFSLAVEKVLANIAGGVTLAVTKPFHDGDFVEIGSKSGTIEAVNLIYTTIKTVDNKVIHIPNGTMTGSDIINYTEEDKRMLDLTVTASYETPVQLVREALLEAAASVEGILYDPAPFVNVKEYGESSISYYFRVWCKTENYWPVNFAVTEAIKESFDKNGVKMTYNNLNVHVIK